MELTKEYESESHKFIKKFKGKKYSITSNTVGEIIKIKSTDKDIIAYAKKLGLKQDG
tara:strand:+ start:236 stop:406 length:171 start_codon:yes stop_codon:yes gene_type:complete